MIIPIKKIWILCGLLALVLIILNPGINRFKEYNGITGKNSNLIRRKYNFLLFSVYENTDINERYLGIFLNFIDITKHASQNEKQNINIPDTTLIKGHTPHGGVENSIYQTKKGQTYTKGLMLQMGYSENEIRKAVYEGRLIPISPINKKMKLWAGLVGDEGLYSKSYEEFKIKYNSIDSINFLFNGLFEDKLYTKSKTEFYHQYFPEMIPKFDSIESSKTNKHLGE